MECKELLKLVKKILERAQKVQFEIFPKGQINSSNFYYLKLNVSKSHAFLKLRVWENIWNFDTLSLNSKKNSKI